MKTKIIYVLVSNENDCYLEQALVSIYSLRLYNPDANLLLLVDEETSRTLENGIRKLILNYVSKLVIVDVPFHYSKQQKSRYIKTSLRSQVIGDFLFIDCDTIINEELKDIDNLSCEIAAVPDCHLSIKYSWMKTNIKKWSWDGNIQRMIFILIVECCLLKIQMILINFMSIGILCGGKMY
mgnify:CR=1 FL=1